MGKCINLTSGLLAGSNVSEFEEMVIQAAPDGTLVKLKDVGRAELGAENYNSFLRFRGKDGVGILVFPCRAQCLDCC